MVSVNNVDGDHIAAILTDGMNNEIQCNVGHLQTSTEVTTGHGHLMGSVLTIHFFLLIQRNVTLNSIILYHMIENNTLQYNTIERERESNII